ncbi:hypothetical protein [Gemmatimonas sp.]|uniref:hypothetical protein n=1 Tax=Gemmatimonas sp. TaxID=1962908 RepID=UPI00286B8250|nr:hypothetical protein [Gemmatimonas sp.]
MNGAGDSRGAFACRHPRSAPTSRGSITGGVAPVLARRSGDVLEAGQGRWWSDSVTPGFPTLRVTAAREQHPA